jgi:hypothetical protein
VTEFFSLKIQAIMSLACQCPAHRAILDHKEFKVHQVRQVLKVAKVIKVIKALQGYKAMWDQQVLKVIKDHRAAPELKERKA